MEPRVMVLYGEGLNCEEETAHAFKESGADARLVHIRQMIEEPAILDDYQVLAVPGGFLHGDALGAGRLMGVTIRKTMMEEVKKFIDGGKLIIGICNGYQVLVNAGLLPAVDSNYGDRAVTLAPNEIGRFRDQWVYLSPVEGNRCVWTGGIDHLYLPIRHGEGQFIPRDSEVLDKMYRNGQVVLKYADSDRIGRLSYNPNGSVDDIAGICDPTGRIFGLMPHPEAYNHRTNHPRWTREDLPEKGEGLKVFGNAVRYFR